MQSLHIMRSYNLISNSSVHVFFLLQIALDHLPTTQTKVGGHEKRFAAAATHGFSPIRITPHFIEPLYSTFRSQLTSETGALMKVLSLLNHTLLVRRISGNMMISPTCDEYAYGPNKGKCRNIYSTNQCGPYTVPSQYLGTRQVCTSLYGSCSERGANGTGAENTDFLLFVGTKGKFLPSIYTQWSDAYGNPPLAVCSCFAINFLPQLTALPAAPLDLLLHVLLTSGVDHLLAISHCVHQ